MHFSSCGLFLWVHFLACIRIPACILMILFDFTIWENSKEEHNLGKRRGRGNTTLTTMKIDTFVPNYIEEYNPFKVSRNILLKTSHLLWATSLLWGFKWEGNQLVSIETVQHKEELNFGPLVCQLQDSHTAPHQFKSPTCTFKNIFVISF